MENLEEFRLMRIDTPVETLVELENDFAALARNIRTIVDGLRSRPGMTLQLQTGKARHYLDFLTPWSEKCVAEAKAAINKYDRMIKAETAAREMHQSMRRNKNK